MLNSLHYWHGEPNQGEVSMPAVQVVINSALIIANILLEVTLFKGVLFAC